MKWFCEKDIDKFKQLLNDTLNNKEVMCKDCNSLAKFITEKDYEKQTDEIPYIYGSTIVCKKCHFEDDITQACAILKSGDSVNLADYFIEIGLDEEPENWDEALKILQRIENELKDRKRTVIKTKDEITLEQRRATELHEVLDVMFYTELDLGEDGVYETYTSIPLKNKNDDNSKDNDKEIILNARFINNEPRVEMLFFVQNVEEKCNEHESMINFKNNMLKNRSLRETVDKYFINFGYTEDKTGVFEVQYTFNDYNYHNIMDIIMLVMKSVIENVYKLKEDTKKDDFSDTTLKTYIHLRRLAELILGYNEAVETLYFDEEEFYLNESFSEVDDIKIGMETELTINNLNYVKNEIIIKVDDDYYDDNIDEDSTTINIYSEVDEQGSRVYELVLMEPSDVTKLGRTDDPQKALIAILNTKDSYLNGEDIDIENIFNLKEVTPQFKYLKDKINITNEYNSIIKLLSFLESWNRKNELIGYDIKERFLTEYSNNFHISLNDEIIVGTCESYNKESYSILHTSLKTDNLKQVALFMLSEFGLECKDIDTYIQDANTNLVAPLLEESESEPFCIDEVKEAIRTFEALNKFNIIKNCPDYKTCDYCLDYNGKDDEKNWDYCSCNDVIFTNEEALKSVPKIDICINKDKSKNDYICSNLKNNTPYITAPIEHGGYNFKININRIKNKEDHFIYDLEIIKMKSSVKKMKVEGIKNLISLISNIKTYGDCILDSEDMFKWNDTFKFDEINKIYSSNLPDIKNLAIFEEITKYYPQMDTKFLVRYDDNVSECNTNVYYNNRDFNIFISQLNNSYVLHLMNLNGNTYKDSYFDLKTIPDVVDIITQSDLKGLAKKNKLKESSVLCSVYYQKICSNIDILDYELGCNENWQDNILSTIVELIYLCEATFNEVKWASPRIDRFYPRGIRDLASFESYLKENIETLKNERDSFKTEQGNMKNFTSEYDVHEFCKFINRIYWISILFNIL